MSDIDALCARLAKNNFAQDYADAIYRRQVIQQYNLAVRSRSDRFQSNFVVNWKNDNAGVINTFDRQMQISYKGSYDVAKWLTATVAVNGIYGKSRQKGLDYNGFDSPWAYPAYESLYNTDGTPQLLYTWYNGNQYAFHNRIQIKKTRRKLRSVGLQLPSGAVTYGSIGNITYSGDKVNIQSIPYSQYM